MENELKTYKDILNGKKVMFHELDPNDYWDTFEALKNSYFKGQQRFDMPEVYLLGGMEVSKVHPEVIMTEEEEHLLRSVEKNGVSKKL